MMPSPKDVIYPDGDDCSKCKYCMRIEVGKVICSKALGPIDPGCSWPPSWPTEGCAFYTERPEFREVSE